LLSSKYIILYKAEAIKDLIEIKVWYETISLQVTDKFKNSLLSSELHLIKYPFAFAALNYKNFRRKIITGFPFKIIYKVDKSNSEIIVFAVLHTARSNRFIKKRLKK
jgi:plasmid stabilization system protein ParE